MNDNEQYGLDITIIRIQRDSNFPVSLYIHSTKKTDVSEFLENIMMSYMVLIVVKQLL